MSCLIRCLSCLFCDVLCCQCNCIIFPSPPCEYKVDQTKKVDRDLISEFRTFNSEGRTVPYLKISTKQSLKSKKCFVYFHGNAEDIGSVGRFLEPIVQQLNITFYSVEYPSYGQYYSLSAALISNTIKEDALNFYQYLKLEMDRGDQDIYVMGRSIGSGGASYLAGNRSIPLLVLMSPFDTIKKVAKEMLGCLGGVVKQHFNNEEQIIRFNGKLLVIHGEQDEVIGVTHGKNLVNIYESENPYKNRAAKLYPHRMTHNNFDIRKDVISPISQFLKTESSIV